MFLYPTSCEFGSLAFFAICHLFRIFLNFFFRGKIFFPGLNDEPDFPRIATLYAGAHIFRQISGFKSFSTQTQTHIRRTWSSCAENKTYMHANLLKPSGPQIVSGVSYVWCALRKQSKHSFGSCVSFRLRFCAALIGNARSLPIFRWAWKYL